MHANNLQWGSLPGGFFSSDVFLRNKICGLKYLKTLSCLPCVCITIRSNDAVAEFPCDPGFLQNHWMNITQWISWGRLSP